uniref:Uncharacterized protein n=1 Tax=Odontella aurita TaxID=265563 RepID=A0A7S4HVQ9_9STRA
MYFARSDARGLRSYGQKVAGCARLVAVCSAQLGQMLRVGNQKILELQNAAVMPEGKGLFFGINIERPHPAKLEAARLHCPSGGCTWKKMCVIYYCFCNSGFGGKLSKA